MTIQDSGKSADDQSRFEDLIQRLRTDDSQAAVAVWMRFIRPLLTVADRHLGQALRPKTDPDDIVQSVFNTFFRRCGEGQFEVVNWSSLWGLLVRITERKCARKREHFRTQQRDIGRELPLKTGDSTARPVGMDHRESAPDEQVIIAEIVETLAAEFTKPYERQVLWRLLEGWNIQDISGEVGKSEYTVRGVERRIKRWLTELRDEA